MQKTFVLDTNVLIQSPHALHSFEDNKIVLPIAVLEELDGIKNDEGERGANARQAIRFLEELRRRGSLPEGVPLPGGGLVRLEVNHVDAKLPDGWPGHSPDNRILKVCKGLADSGESAVLVTKDIVARIKAQMLGIPAEDFTTEQVAAPGEQYAGRAHAYIPDAEMDAFHREGIDPGKLYTMGENGAAAPVEAVPNQFFILHSDLSARKTALGRAQDGRVVPLQHLRAQPFGVTARNVGQRFMQEALLLDADQAPLVIVKGAAGTAKTFFSLACGLEQILEAEQPRYRKILVCRPNVQFDEEIGFLPGTEGEKIAPLMRPIIDNLEILVDGDERERYRNEQELRGKIDELFDRGVIAAEAMNFIRGRSITGAYLLIDEAQNLTPRQVKGIITRVGSGTKVVLLGDPQQIDHPLLDEQTNGLSYAAEKMKGSPLCYQLTSRGTSASAPASRWTRRSGCRRRGRDACPAWVGRVWFHMARPPDIPATGCPGAFRLFAWFPRVPGGVVWRPCGRKPLRHPGAGGQRQVQHASAHVVQPGKAAHIPFLAAQAVPGVEQLPEGHAEIGGHCRPRL